MSEPTRSSDPMSHPTSHLKKKLSTNREPLGDFHYCSVFDASGEKKLCSKCPDTLDTLDASNATCLTRTQFTIAPCIRTQLMTVSAYRTKRVRAFSFWTQLCQGIFLLNAAMSGHFPSGHSHVRAFSFWTQPCQGKWCPDDACHGITVMLAVKARNITANTLVTFANMQWVPVIVTQSSSILYI